MNDIINNKDLYQIICEEIEKVLHEGRIEKIKKFRDDKIKQIRDLGKKRKQTKVDIEYHVDMVKGIIDSILSDKKHKRSIAYAARVVNDKLPAWAMKTKPGPFHGPTKTGPIEE